MLRLVILVLGAGVRGNFVILVGGGSVLGDEACGITLSCIADPDMGKKANRMRTTAASNTMKDFELMEQTKRVPECSGALLTVEKWNMPTRRPYGTARKTSRVYLRNARVTGSSC
jgi:hypothetical protein